MSHQLPDEIRKTQSLSMSRWAGTPVLGISTFTGHRLVSDRPAEHSTILYFSLSFSIFLYPILLFTLPWTHWGNWMFTNVSARPIGSAKNSPFINVSGSLDEVRSRLNVYQCFI